MTTARARAPLEMWAGLECTLNRVGDEQVDQLERTGHYARPDDVERLAMLGVRTVRYPVLWERVDAGVPDGLPWEWTDARLERLRTLDISPILGLVHHGSGPRWTSLVEPGFAEGLARFAGTVAERYPWVDRFTPINEPLTTARFAGLYGHWYPHGRDALTFARALIGQCRAICLAMAAIRAITPGAQLVQTEDLGLTHSTPALRYQADFENERRWLTFDLLAGRVVPGHPMWDYLRWAGIAEAELAPFADEPCPPSLVGINHYLTSERFLDERLERYPPDTHGGNHRQRYADVEAVRVVAAGVAGPRVLLREAWERYRTPVVVTEAHLACTREQQLRWLGEVWDAASALRAEGCDVRAVTAWSVLGAFDWASLMTRREGAYEPGLFDLRAPEPRPTALAAMVRSLAAEGRYAHPVLDTPGWWRCADRILYPAEDARGTALRHRGEVDAARPILITGATGTLGAAFARLCSARGLAFRLLDRAAMDIADAESVAAALDETGAWAIVNAAGFVRVDEAERDPAACFRANAEGPATLAEACARRDIRLVTFSSDLVFDGTKHAPYVETDAPKPLGVYGASKAEGEMRVRDLAPGALIVRTSAFFGDWDEHNFVTRTLRMIASGTSVLAASDAVVSPTYVPDLVHAVLDLLIDGERGVWHLANGGAVSWAELARRAAELAGLDASRVRACPTSALGLAASRPAYSALASGRGTLLAPLDHALARYARARPWERRPAGAAPPPSVPRAVAEVGGPASHV